MSDQLASDTSSRNKKTISKNDENEETPNDSKKNVKKVENLKEQEHQKLTSVKPKQHPFIRQPKGNPHYQSAPFYFYAQNSRHPQSKAHQKFFQRPTGRMEGSGASAGYHPLQKRSQQFITRYNNNNKYQQGAAPFYHAKHEPAGRQHSQQYQQGAPAIRREHLISCNDSNLIGYHGRRRQSRSINGSKEDFGAFDNGPVSRTKSIHKKNQHRHRSSHSEVVYNGKNNISSEVSLEEPFDSESDNEEGKECKDVKNKTGLPLPLPQRRIHTLSGTVPIVGYSPVWGGPTMCLGCFEFFKLPDQRKEYVEHLLAEHKLVVADIELIVDLKRYNEYWRNRLEKSSLEKIFPRIEPKTGDEFHGKVDSYFLMSVNKTQEDMQIRQRLAMRRLEEVLSCQQRERDDEKFARQCLFCRYQAAGNRAKLIHHLYMIHHLNLGSPDNLVFVNEYLDTLEDKLQNGVCIYCEVKFGDRQELDEHMREKGHREVNPDNSYYDKFYVINYLELGKKWLDVLGEDFEDSMPTFMDSEEEAEEESWHEWQEDNAENEHQELLCLLCDKANRDLENLLKHMKDDHGFDLQNEVKAEKMDFYDKVKFVNYIRACCHHYHCFVCGKDDLHSWAALSKHLCKETYPGHASKIPDRTIWDKEEFLIPTFENDTLLCRLDELGDDDDDAEQRARRSLPPDPAILDSGPVVENGGSNGQAVMAEDPFDLTQSILSDKELRDSLN